MGRRKNGETLADIIKRTLFLLGTAALIFSCGDKRPEDVLTKQEMVEVMEELYVAEEKVNQLSLSRDSAKKVFQAMSERVFRDASTSDSAFKRSFDYYMERPEDMELIYSALVDTLQLREQRTPYDPAAQ